MRIRDQTPNGEGSRSRNIKKTRIQQAVDSKLCAHTHTHAHPLTSAAQIANASVKQKKNPALFIPRIKRQTLGKSSSVPAQVQMAGSHAQQIQAERICEEARPFTAARAEGTKEGTVKTRSCSVM